MAGRRKTVEETVVRYCRDCVHSTPDMKFENLSLSGEPTLLSCPFQQWKLVITTTAVCKEYAERVAVTETSESKNPMDDWLAW